MTVHKILSLFAVILLVSSCSNTGGSVEMKNLQGKWPKKAEQKFTLEIEDAQHPKNIIFVVRNNNDYPYSNIRLFAHLNEENLPTKNVDTLNYILAEPNGNWLGKGFGDTKEILFQYKINYKFPKPGRYQIGVTHGMRTDTLKGIEDIGVKVETLKP